MAKKKTTVAVAAVRTKKGGEEDELLDASFLDESQQPDVDVPPPPPIPSEPTQPIVESYTWTSAVPSECSKLLAWSGSGKVPCVLGVDEAGRGPVLGPLVYGIAYCPLEYQPLLKEIGFADSKALTAEKRDSLLDALISKNDQLGWAVRVMSPQDISAGMLRRRPINLNAQSSQATVGLIQGVLDSGVDVTEIYVDTVGDPKSYSRLLSSHFPRHPHIKWTVTSKADAIYPIVGAASIAAKVTRDRCIENWKYAEQSSAVDAGAKAKPWHSSDDSRAEILVDATNRPISHPQESGHGKKRKAEDDRQDLGTTPYIWSNLGQSGSGYPGDPNTVAYLKRTLDPVFGWSGIVRFSWATAKTMLEEKVKYPSPSASGSNSATQATPKPNVVDGGKRTTRSLSRSNSIADASSVTTASQEVSSNVGQSPQPKSLFGTPLPTPSTGIMATRAYKVKWIDEPVSISKFFGSAAAAKPKSKIPTLASTPAFTASSDHSIHGNDHDEDSFRISETQRAVNLWLQQESTGRAQTSGDGSNTSIGKLQKSLGFVNSAATLLA